MKTAFDEENAELGVATAYGRVACTSPVRNNKYAITLSETPTCRVQVISSAAILAP